MRKCIGSAKFGIGAHEAPPDEFPAQPSQKDGLGRMCKPHWNSGHPSRYRRDDARPLCGSRPMSAASPPVGWRNRITGAGDEAPNQLLAKG